MSVITDEEFIAMFAIVASNMELHVGACEAYKQTGTRVALLRWKRGPHDRK